MTYKVVELNYVKISYYDKEEIHDVFTGCYGIFPDKLYHQPIKKFESALNLICQVMNWKLISLTLYGDESYNGQTGLAIFEILEKEEIKPSEESI